MKAIQNLKSPDWWLAAGVRALRTAAQSAISSIGATKLFYEVDWRIVGGAVAMSTIISILMSIAGLPETEKDG